MYEIDIRVRKLNTSKDCIVKKTVDEEISECHRKNIVAGNDFFRTIINDCLNFFVFKYWLFKWNRIIIGKELD